YAIPLNKLHLSLGGAEAIRSIEIVGGLILLVAAINFACLMTATLQQRNIEVGMRKVCGATRSELMVQFTGEGVIYVAVSMVLALAMTELLLPGMNSILDWDVTFEPQRDLGLFGWILALVLGTGICVGLYPALTLSALRPTTILRRASRSMDGSGLL